MSEIYYKVFTKPGDYLKWHKLIEYIDLLDDLSIEEKNQIKESYKYLSDVLGKKFLIHSSKYQHKIVQRMNNKAPWALKWNVWFADAIKAIKDNNHKSEDILNKLKSLNEYDEGFSFLELSYYFFKGGFKLAFEEPLKIKNGISNPDIKLINPENGDEIYAEVSSLNISNKHDVKKNYFGKVSNIFGFDSFIEGIHYCGEILEYGSEEEHRILNLIREKKQEAINNESFVEIIEPKIKLAIAHKNKISELNNWANKYNLKVNSLTGEKINFDTEISRIKNKIQKEYHHFEGSNTTNLVLIPIHTLFILAGKLPELIIEIDSELKKYPEVLGVLIYGNFSWAKEESHVIFFNHMISTSIFEGVDKHQYIFIRNNHIQHNIKRETIEMVYNSFKFGKAIEHELGNNIN